MVARDVKNSKNPKGPESSPRKFTSLDAARAPAAPSEIGVRAKGGTVPRRVLNITAAKPQTSQHLPKKSHSELKLNELKLNEIDPQALNRREVNQEKLTDDGFLGVKFFASAALISAGIAQLSKWALSSSNFVSSIYLSFVVVSASLAGTCLRQTLSEKIENSKLSNFQKQLAEVTNQLAEPVLPAIAVYLISGHPNLAAYTYLGLAIFRIGQRAFFESRQNVELDKKL